MHKASLFSLGFVVAIVLSGCAAGTSAGGMSGMNHSATQPSASGDTITQTQQMTDTQTMTEGQISEMDHGTTTSDSTKPFDAQFIDGMIEHHQGAIDMAEQALEQAEHPELQQMAEDIVTVQTQEIDQMTGWRQSWYPDLAPTGGMSMGMGDMEISTDESKPFDQRFLEAMISHHQGAIDMAGMALQTAEHDEIKTLADTIIAAQKAEIEQMQSWLQAWYGVSQ